MSREKIRAAFFALALGAGVAATSSAAQATVVYDFNLTGSINVTGTIDFMGDLSTDGTFALVASDIADFELVFPQVTFTELSTISFIDTYTVTGGNLSALDIDFDQGCAGYVTCRLTIFAAGEWYLDGMLSSFGYDELEGGTYAFALSSVSPAPLPVPAPAALPLFLSGLASVGFFGWRRKRRDAAAA